MRDAPAHNTTFPDALVSVGVVAGITPRGVRLRSPELGEQLARNAVVGDWDPAAGDQVVIVADGRGQCFVVGVLSALREARTPEPRVEERPDLGLAVERTQDGATRLTVEGDLELAAPTGRVRIHAAEGVDVGSPGEVSLRSRRGLTLESHDGERTRSSLKLDRDAAELKAGVLALRAAKLVALAEEIRAVAHGLDARVDEMRSSADRVEHRIGTLVERAKESYREVEGLSQTRAGRVRLVAESSLSALADRVKLKAKAVFAIDGESIHLG